MKTGRKKRVKWHKMRASGFKFPEPVDWFKGESCGSLALYAITKISRRRLAKLFKRGHCPTEKMIGFLKKKGYVVEQITLGNTVRAHSVKGDGKPKISSRSVILLDQACYMEEDTWSVLHEGLMWHSGELEEMKPVEFINNPINDAYLIWHPDWAKKEWWDI